MLYSDLSEVYSRVEKETKRLNMTDELIGLFSRVKGPELEIVIRLTKGEVRPGYEGIELGVAEKLLDKALYQVTMLPLDVIEKKRLELGDVGLMAEEVIGSKRQSSLFSEPLTVERVFKNLERISLAEGRDSQDLKLKIIAEMMHDASPLEARYLARTLCQKLRLGIADMTMIDALSYLFTEGTDDLSKALMKAGSDNRIRDLAGRIATRETAPIYELEDLLSHPNKYRLNRTESEGLLNLVTSFKASISMNREDIERLYNIHPDLGLIGRKLSEEGMAIKERIKVAPGVPLRSMLGERLGSIPDILEKMEGAAAFEYKYDGLRAQAHIPGNNGLKAVRLFSRQLEDITSQFPDVASSVSSSFSKKDCIVEGECVPIDPDTGELMPFQLISQRRGRKYDLTRKVREVPVCFVLFDCLYLDGIDLTGRPYLERRSAIGKAFPGISEQLGPGKGLALSTMRTIDDPAEGEGFFDTAIDAGCEGIMVKSISPDSIYQSGSRGWLWIKYKREYGSELSDTLDLAVVGAFLGTGRRKGTFGALLMAAYDPSADRFVTTCKLGSGFTDDNLKTLPSSLKDQIVPKGREWTRVFSKIEPDIRIYPSMVLEVLGSEITFSPMHTCGLDKLRKGVGLAIRFPRFTGRFRDDKAPEQATTSGELERMYTYQRKSIKE